MPNQPPSDRTRAKGRPPVFNRSLSRFIGSLFSQRSPRHPITRNEPNPSTSISAKRTLKPNARHRRASTYLTPVFQPGSSQQPKNAKQTQSHKANSQKYETNPIPAAVDLWRTKKCETNPIPAHQGSRQPRISAKRTQFPRTRYPACIELVESPNPNFCETNPICPHAHPAPPQKMQNEPNFRIPGVPPPPISTKRTQFAPTVTLPHPKKSKRTQFPARRKTPNLQYTIYTIQSLGVVFLLHCGIKGVGFG